MDCTASLDVENKELRYQVQDLIKELENKENQVILSAQFGKQLLESNSELNRQLEEIQESNLTQIEELRQENYSLKMKIQSDCRARDNFTIEFENVKMKLQEDAKHEISSVTINHSKKVDELSIEIESLQAEVERKTLITEQLQEKVLKQDEMLTEAHKYSKQLQEMDVLETAVEELKEECVLMRFSNDELNIKLADVSDENQQLLFDKQNLNQKMESVKENLEETTAQSKSWFEALQNSRHQISELQMEISALKAEVLNRSHKDKGNSLFGEVEDKRLELQQKYATTSTKYESLQKIHQVVKRQLHQYKSQILPMLQMAGNQADSSKIKRLEAALSQSQSEIQKLNIKMRDVKRENQDHGLSTRLESLHDVVINSKDKKDYITLLQNEITCLKETIADLQTKREVTALKLLAETDKRRETESQLHTSEVKKEKLEHEIVRLRLKLEDLTIKLQQDAKNNGQIREQSNTREAKQSIWRDSNLFTRTKVSQQKTIREVPDQKPKDSILVKSSSDTQQKDYVIINESLSSTKLANTTTGDKVNLAEYGERISSESAHPSKPDEMLRAAAIETQNRSKKVAPVLSAAVAPVKVKPVGRVLPLNESLAVNESLANKENDNTVQNINPHEKEEDSYVGKANIKTSLVQSNTTISNDVSLVDNISNEKSQHEELRVSHEKPKQRRREPQRERVIHVKKIVGAQNECKQQ